MTSNRSLREILEGWRSPLGPETRQQDSPWQHWRMGTDDRGTVWLVLDRQGSSVNLVDAAILEELDDIVGRLEQDRPNTLVLRSAKDSGFCAGADIGMFRGMSDPDAVAEKLRWAHAIVDRFERLRTTKVALIHGACLGGGLELALACDYRIAMGKAKLGFPEVQLGLHPGLGGSFRSTALMDPLQAMTLMLTGKALDARKARRMGLVDAAVEERHAFTAVTETLSKKPDKQRPPRYSSLIASRWGRELAARRMAAQTRKKVSQDHYPAPFQLIELWREHGGDRKAMQQAEIDSFARLVASPEGQNLVRVFFLRETLKQQAAVDAPPCRHVHVVGAGTMGGDIAAWCALRGLRVTLGDRDNTVIAAAIKRASRLCASRRMDRHATRDTLDRLIPDPNGDGIPHADLLIEAVPEKVEIKRAVYNELQQRIKPDALLATNTSSIPLETLSQEVAYPDRFIGLHFFNPVAKMQLVEVVSHERASSQSLDRGRAFAGTIDRLPVPVRSAPGFLVNRVLTPYLLEAMVMLDEGVSAETIDRAALDFGMPMGPLEMADRVGLDICVAVGDMLREQLDNNTLPEVPQWLRKKVEDGDTGQKSGRGFYTWDDGKPKKGKADTPPEDTADRLILPLLNACVSCLREQVVGDRDTLDATVVFGTGFAPFRGGPLHYAQQRGVDEVRQVLTRLAERHGDRFQPDDGWADLGQPPARDS